MSAPNVSSLVPTHYESTGLGIPIVFIHPPQMDHMVFQYQRMLAEHFQVILYDIRGHGRSGISGERPTIKRLAADLLKLLDLLEIDKAVICGYSCGGSVAQEFTLSYPERVKALILSGGFPKVSTFLLKNEFRAGMALVKSGNQRLLSRILAFSHHVTEEDRRKLFKHCIRADEQTALQYYKESFHYDCTDQLPELSVPLLLLTGSRAYHMHPYLKIYSRLVDNIQIVRIANASHQLPMRSYQPFNHAIKKFIQGLD